jgi:hypothetical protein
MDYQSWIGSSFLIMCKIASNDSTPALARIVMKLSVLDLRFKLIN